MFLNCACRLFCDCDWRLQCFVIVILFIYIFGLGQGAGGGGVCGGVVTANTTVLQVCSTFFSNLCQFDSKIELRQN